jgi:hypothetical protein
MVEMNGIARVYKDRDGGLRLYLPKRLADSLRWKEGEEIWLEQTEDTLRLKPAVQVKP